MLGESSKVIAQCLLGAQAVHAGTLGVKEWWSDSAHSCRKVTAMAVWAEKFESERFPEDVWVRTGAGMPAGTQQMPPGYQQPCAVDLRPQGGAAGPGFSHGLWRRSGGRLRKRKCLVLLFPGTVAEAAAGEVSAPEVDFFNPSPSSAGRPRAVPRCLRRDGDSAAAPVGPGRGSGRGTGGGSVA